MWQLEAELREQEVSESSSRGYCRSFCQTLLQYAGNRTTSEHVGPPLLEVYRLAIQSFASARPFLTTECEDVLLVLGRLVLSCFELLLSVPESDLPSEVWVPFHQTIQDSHDALLEFGNNNLQVLVDITKEGVWKNPTLLKVLSQQPVDPEDASRWMALEGPFFLQMRIKHLLKSNCIPQATALSRLCAEAQDFAGTASFRLAYITCLCSLLPSEEAIKEIAKLDCKEVLDITCNLESEGQDNTAFILCTTYLTQQLQTASVYCSWELTLFWSKLQRRIDPSLDTFLERCRQFGVIAKTQQHLFCLIRVAQAEAEGAGLGVSVLLCVRALQIRTGEDDEMKASVCKTISCLLPDDLEVRRACQLTEFLLEPSPEGFGLLEELYLQPDQKFDEENAPVPNSLRCELLLALKAHWPFDPEFWDWKTLKRHCHQLLGQAASDSDGDLSGYELSLHETDVLESFLSDYEEAKEDRGFRRPDAAEPLKEKPRDKKPIGSSERYQRWLQYKFFCALCKRECIEARILHHSKMHMEDGVYTCPVCLRKFKKKEFFVPHVMEHVKMPPSRRDRPKKKLLVKREQPAKALAPPDPDPQPPSVAGGEPEAEGAAGDPHEYVTFRNLEACRLQDRDLYPCPGTDCSRVFKQFKYLSVHLKAEHQNDDANARHYLDMKNRREKCAFCRRHFMTAFHLRQHEQVHRGPQPYLCVSIGCSARFSSVNELLHHKQKHDDLRYRCELRGCGVVSSDLGQLYHHEAQHFRDASYTCTVAGCKKFYYSKAEFRDHLLAHAAPAPPAGLSNGGPASPAAGPGEDRSPPGCPGEPRPPEDPPSGEGAAGAPPEPGEAAAGDPAKDPGDSGSSGRLSPSSSTSGNEGDPDPSPSEGGAAVCFDGKRFTCGLAGCGSAYKNARGMQRHLRKAHPYHFKPKKRPGGRPGDPPQILDPCRAAGPPDAQRACSDSGSESPDESPERPAPSARRVGPGSCRPGPEDAMLELLLGLKHLSLQNAASRLPEPPAEPGAPPASPGSAAEAGRPDGPGGEAVSSQYLAQLAAKPFFCELQGCKFEFVTREALLMHYVRKHDYSREQVLQLSMFQHRYSPFQCHICQRSFTRKTHLRIHYKNKHQISSDRTPHKLFGKKKVVQAGSVPGGRLKGRAPGPVAFCPNGADRGGSETDPESSGEEPGGAPREGRGSRRTVARGNLCYVLSKIQKPFRCIHKSCTSAFTSLKGLIRHYRTVHRYSREQVCLEKDKARRKRELVKFKKVFVCKFKECSKRFLGAKALAKHCSDCHHLDQLEGPEPEGAPRLPCGQPQCPAACHSPGKLRQHRTEQRGTGGPDWEIHCDLDGCGRVFSHRSGYSQHVFFRHRDFYDGLFRSPKAEPGGLPGSETQPGFPGEDPEGGPRPPGARSRKCGLVREKQPMAFKTREEALGMCLEQAEHTQYPCMVRGCLSVVKLESSIVRHYKRTHQMSCAYLEQELQRLVLCVEYGTRLTPPSPLDPDPGAGGRDGEEEEGEGGKEEDEEEDDDDEEGDEEEEDDDDGEEPGGEEEEEEAAAAATVTDESRDCAAGRTGVPRVAAGGQAPSFATPEEGSQGRAAGTPLLGAETFLYRSTMGAAQRVGAPEPSLWKAEQSVLGGAQSRAGFTDLPSLPPGRRDPGDWRLSAGPDPAARVLDRVPREPLVRKAPPPRPIDLRTYKPMGFESSFLKFIQESEEKEDDWDEWEPPEPGSPSGSGRAESPGARAESPGGGAGSPSGAAGSPGAAAGSPGLAAGSPGAAAGSPGLAAGSPGAAAGSPGAAAGSPGAAAGSPCAAAGSPCAAAGSPDAAAESPGVAGEALRDASLPQAPAEPALGDRPTADSPGGPSLQDLQAILDKALTDCGELALKQLHYLRPVVVLERPKFSAPLLDLFPPKKADELCVGSS
ncbi:zinc finger protein Rlf [Ornithorhynchus anatinus]|nr:zinc finger protein Rlf [Ornithorhynchus anatinus]